MTSQTTISKLNGIDIDMVHKTVDAIQEDSTRAKYRFRGKNKWLAGCRNSTSFTGFHGWDKEYAHKQTFVLDADEPSMLSGSDEAANPVEQLIGSLAACLTTSMVAQAALNGIKIDEVESEVEGDLDLRGFLGLAHDVRPGYQDIRIKFKVKADSVDVDRLKELASYSPVFDVISHGTPVDIEIEKM